MSLLRDDPLLLVFVVAAVGYLVGRVRVAGFGFGVAAVLFVCLAFGMADPELKVPRALWTLGLVLFVYTVGLAAGPGFVAALRRRGAGANGLVLGALCAAAGTIVAVGVAVGLGAEETAGAYAGGLTNTPALAASLEALREIEPEETFDAASGRVLVGYSLGYPIGVTVALLAVFWLVRRRGPVEGPAPPVEIVVRTALVEATALGRESDERLELEHAEVDFRRMVVSKRVVAGCTAGALELPHRFGDTVTRVRRGDALGLLLGTVDVPLPGGGSFRLASPAGR